MARQRMSLPSMRPGMKNCLRWAAFVGWILLAGGLALLAGLSRGQSPGQSARVKDVATIEGIRDNQLVGYGLVVGLRGTGDSSETVLHAQTLISSHELMVIHD